MLRKSLYLHLQTNLMRLYLILARYTNAKFLSTTVLLVALYQSILGVYLSRYTIQNIDAGK